MVYYSALYTKYEKRQVKACINVCTVLKVQLIAEIGDFFEY